MKLIKEPKSKFNYYKLREICSELTDDQVAIVAYGIEKSQQIYAIYNDNNEIVCVFALKILQPKKAYMSVFYVLPKFRRTTCVKEAIKLASEVAIEFNVITYYPLDNVKFPIRYCKRRTIDHIQAYKDTHKD